MYLKKNGFTLVEVLVASMIGAFVALVAVGTLRTISASAEMVDNNTRTAAEVRFASNMVARDLKNLYRDKDVGSMRLIGGFDESVDGAVSWLTLYTVGGAKARIGWPEGDVYEVEYYLLRDGEKSALMRRLWPNPDKEVEPGGMLTVIAEDIDVFVVSFFDGEEWQVEWPEKMKSIPELVEVTIVAEQPGRRKAVFETFVVNFARSAWGQGDAGSKREKSEEKEEGESEN
ncbi:MAG: type II secretion system protein GspJ [Planctomycetota bacterium]|jgi:type II secretion system protein J